MSGKRNGTPGPELSQIGPMIRKDGEEEEDLRDIQNDKTNPGLIVTHHTNHELVTLVGNLAIEAREHSLSLQTLYEMLRHMHVSAPQNWAKQLLLEFERHHERTGTSIEALRSYVSERK